MRILVSVSNKTGLVDLINKLLICHPELEIISTSGTCDYLKKNNINSTLSIPEILIIFLLDLICFDLILNSKIFFF